MNHMLLMQMRIRKKALYGYIAQKPTQQRLLSVAGDAILDYSFLDAQGVQLKIDRKAFRGIHCAFRNVK